MAKTVSEILGIENALSQEDLEKEAEERKTVTEYEIDDQKVTTEIVEASETSPENGQALEVGSDIDRINEANDAIDVLIKEGLKAVRETISFSDGLEPRSKNRALEVAANLMSETTRAIKHKQDFGLNLIKTKMEVSKHTNNSIDNGGGSVNINNYYGDRETLLRQIKSENEKDES
jgi:hypothetical protein